MLSKIDIKGLDLPPKTLCLTYDDGPGPSTSNIGRFLQERGVRATFFVVGKFAIERPDVLQELHDAGHLIGNHTYEHPDMPYYVSVNGDIRDQIIRTNALIGKFNRSRATYLRATYGKWSPEVANELNMDVRSSFRHVGPIYWEIGGIDCHFWRLGKSVEEALEAYVADIEANGRGIMVMHDGAADMEAVAALNQTLELTKRLIPLLQERGYSFVGLDEIDDPQLTTARNDTFLLRGQNGRMLRYGLDKDSALTWSGSPTDTGVEYVLDFQPEGKTSFRCADGRYLAVNADVDSTVRLREEFDPSALFDLIPLREGQFMVRSFNGNYLASDESPMPVLKANAVHMRQAWQIQYIPSSGAYAKPQTLVDKIDKAKRRLRFVRSKLLPS